MGYIFDGQSQVINLTSGTTSFDVSEMWSRWVDWFGVGDNSKYLLAMRTVGGDPISSTKSLGVTFFMINGWKIRPQESNHKLSVNGNLFTDPAGDSPFVSTLGSFNVVIEMSVSNLSDSTVTQLPEIEYASFQNMVTIDVATGKSGTTYPTGTTAFPVNNLEDALVIASYRGFDSLRIKGNLTLESTDNVSGFSFYGDGATFNVTKTLITLIDGCSTSNTKWHSCRITGVQWGESQYYNCVIGALSNAHCHYENCMLVGPIQFANDISPTHTTAIIGCYTNTVGCLLDYNGSSLKQIYSEFTGKLQLQNYSNPLGLIIIGIAGGELILDSSCVAGTVMAYGSVDITDNSVGTTVLHQGQAGAEEVASAVWSNPFVSKLLTVAKFLGLK